MEHGESIRGLGIGKGNLFLIMRKILLIKCKKLHRKVDFFPRTNIIRVTEPNTPLNDADHVGSFNFKENIVWENLNSISLL